MKSLKWTKTKREHIRIFLAVSGAYILLFSLGLLAMQAISGSSLFSPEAALDALSPEGISVTADRLFVTATPLGFLLLTALLWLAADIKGLLKRQIRMQTAIYRKLDERETARHTSQTRLLRYHR